ncbi:MAG: AAA family ATPase [Gallionellaceae bacterium]
MDAHFLTEIEIEEFKCFKGFKTSGFKRVNLIGGKNNIGKTALIEAMFINAGGSNVNKMNTAFYTIKFARENQNFVGKRVDYLALLNATKKYAVASNIVFTYFSIEEGAAVKYYRYRINGEEYVINATEFNFIPEWDGTIQFIDNFGWSDQQLIEAYKAVQIHDQESELNRYIHEFDDSIDNFKIIGDKPQCRSNGEYRDITEFGDGLKSYISMICALHAGENGYLFIDEIDNGIHYTQLDRLWEIILTLSKQTNCQVFASTHSKEMIDSFTRTAKRLEEQDISYTLLVKNKDREIKTISLGYADLVDNVIDQAHEVR